MRRRPDRRRDADDGAVPRDQGAHPDCLLFYRMGDFYELFFDDAVQGRGGARHRADQARPASTAQDIPMCGVPVHAAEAYLARLIRQGFKVAVCEQIEDPAEAQKRGAKSVVRARRGARRHARHADRGRAARRAPAQLPRGARRGRRRAGARLARHVDRRFRRRSRSAPSALAAALARLEPGEILLPERLLAAPALFEAARRLEGGADAAARRRASTARTARRRLRGALRRRGARRLRRLRAAPRSRPPARWSTMSS